MKKSYINAIIFTLSLILGFLLISMYDSSKDILNDDNIGERQVSLIREEINKAYIEKRSLYDTINSLKSDMRVLEEKLEKNEKSHEDLMEELNSYKVLSGGFNVKGQGIIIDIKVPENISEYYGNLNVAEYYWAILSIVSYMNSAGAEAIAINDQRYTSNTEIVPVENYLNINGKRVIAPIEIKAIGDKRTLSSTINFPSGVLEQLQSYGFEIEITESDEVEINAISNLKEFKFAIPYDSVEEAY
jgi:uncharacterized protein YlxW (UPF0749 family)